MKIETEVALIRHCSSNLLKFPIYTAHQVDISPERIPDHLRALGEGVHTEMCRRFMFLLDVSLMVNHDTSTDSFCYNLIVMRKGIHPLRMNEIGNKLCVAMMASDILAYYIDSGAREFATLDWGDPNLFDNITKTIERFFKCHAHRSNG